MKNLKLTIIKTSIALFALLICCISAQAQSDVTYQSSNPDISITKYACYVSGNDCILEIVMLNNSGKKLDLALGAYFAFYDDEGNIYDRSGAIADASGTFWANRMYVLPANVPVKAVIKCKNISIYATMLSKVIIGDDYHDTVFEINNVPISRQSNSL